MPTIYVYTELHQSDIARATALLEEQHFASRVDSAFPSTNADWVTLSSAKEFFALSEDATEMSDAAELVDRLLTTTGVQHVARGGGRTFDEEANSTFLIRPIGSTDAAESLTINAKNRVQFEERFTRFSPTGTGTLEGYEVLVSGLAANDANVQEAPFFPQR